MANVVVPLTGWGYDTWGSDGWSESPALPFSTGQVGSVSITGDALVSVTGVAGTSGLGTAAAQADAIVGVTGVSA
jgi:hypothetical protein